MRVLVIGGTNFIGPHVVAALDRLGAEGDSVQFHRGAPPPAWWVGAYGFTYVSKNPMPESATVSPSSVPVKVNRPRI